MAFDLDDDELKATKIMNGTLKDEEEKDEEEKDIKFIRKYMQDYFFEDIAIEDDFEFEKAIKKLLTKYKNLAEIEAEHQRINGELREKVKQLEEDNEDLKNIANNKQWISPCYVVQNYIPTSLVEEKIEELNKRIDYLKIELNKCYIEREKLGTETDIDNNETAIFYMEEEKDYIYKQKDILKELLEGRK